MGKKRRILFFASITLLLLILGGCRSAKFLDADQTLVKQVHTSGIPLGLKEQAGLYVSNEIRPNSPLNLTIYNVFNTKNGAYKSDKIRQVGEAPRLLDSSLVELSALQIQRFLQTKGYFNAQVKPQVTIKKKKAVIDFVTDTQAPFYIHNLHYDFEDKALGDIYNQEVLPTTTIVKGEQYDAAKLLEERERLFLAVKNKGYYDFLRQYMRIGIDTNMVGDKADLTLGILKPEKGAHRQYRLNNVSVKIKSLAGMKPKFVQYKDSLSGIDFSDETGLYRLKPIARYAFLRPGQRYNLSNENLSYDRLYEMNGFRSVKINYEKVDSTQLNVTYELVPRSLMANQVEGEFTFSSGMSGFNIGNTFSHRNIFGGAELLEVKLRYGVLFDPRLDGSLQKKIFNNDFQVGVNLVVPRLMLPFSVSSTARYGLAKTTFSSSLQLFNQDKTYSNRYFINTLNYSWWQRKNLQHSYTPLVVEYRDGRFDPDFKARLQDEGYQLYLESNDRQYFGLGAQYSVTWNAAKLFKLGNFSFIRGSVDASGNALGLLSSVFKFRENPDGMKTIFGVTYLQYIKGEVDYRLYRHLGGNKQFVFRFNGGVALPYGNNSKLLIFEKSFFAGGINGIRAWQARTLGPGNYNRETIKEDIRLNLRNLDQLGEIKLESNLEYRFRILNNVLGAKMNGATFVDMGNIWRLRADSPNKNGEFVWNKLFNQIAIGSGFGLRFDMDYFVIRLDAGIKIKDPQFAPKEQWVIKHFFNAKDFKANYYQTNSPDRYSFIQYNFSVGLPF
ncbi:BamA/TamA family outer membrane protein [Sphingobacterium sp. Mn56C]|uniref:translocation and assembly module lipoprotein TamL n=1 Tax=Sphingobacterium sp. Mn56C TaxID=3395261 RepID=UPI003BF506AC